MENNQTILQNGHSNIYLPAGIQKLTLASMFSEYRHFLKTMNAEIIIEPVNIPMGNATQIANTKKNNKSFKQSNKPTQL